MLTIFSIPKAFNGPIGTIQRNAIKSWTLLRPECEVILMGDDEGTGEAAADLGVKNIPGVNRNEFGTPLLDHAYQLAQDEATNPLLCYVNADIILMRDFLESVETVRKKTDWFLMTARRWNLDVEEKLDFGVGWEDRLMGEVSNKGELGHHAEIDFWVYPKGLLSGIPPAGGRPHGLRMLVPVQNQGDEGGPDRRHRQSDQRASEPRLLPPSRRQVWHRDEH